MRTITLKDGPAILIFRRLISVCEFDLIVTAFLLLNAGKNIKDRKHLLKTTLKLMEHKGLDYFSKVISRRCNCNWQIAKETINLHFPELKQPMIMPIPVRKSCIHTDPISI